MYTMYRRIGSSSELRSIKYSIEKTSDLDLIEFYLRVKIMIATVHSVPTSELYLDQTLVATKELLPLLGSIFGQSVINKTPLLTLIQSRSREHGVLGSDICAILLVDFVKCRDRDIAFANEHSFQPSQNPSGALNLRAQHIANRSLTPSGMRYKEQEYIAEDIDQATFLKKQKKSQKRIVYGVDTEYERMQEMRASAGLTQNRSLTPTLKFKTSKKQYSPQKHTFKSGLNTLVATGQDDYSHLKCVDNFNKTLRDYGIEETDPNWEGVLERPRPKSTKIKPKQYQKTVNFIDEGEDDAFVQAQLEHYTKNLKTTKAPNKGKSVFLDDNDENLNVTNIEKDPEVEIVSDEPFYHLVDPKPAKTISKEREEKMKFRKKLDPATEKQILVSTREEMLYQMNYILNEKQTTEDRIMNGMALLKSNVNLYNSMLDYSQKVKKTFFEMYFKIKGHSKGKGLLPVKNEELRLFRSIDEIEKMSYPEEVAKVNEETLFTETLHKIRKYGQNNANKLD